MSFMKHSQVLNFIYGQGIERSYIIIITIYHKKKAVMHDYLPLLRQYHHNHLCSQKRKARANMGVPSQNGQHFDAQA